MKKYAISTLLIGILFISIGIVIISSSDNQNNNDLNQNNDNNDNKSSNIVIDTSKIEGDEIDNSNYKNYTIDKYVKNNVYSQNLSLKNIYNFSYESSLEDVVLGNNVIRAKNNNSSVVSFASTLSENNIKFEFILNYKNLGFDKLKTYESTETIKISDLNIKYIKLEAARTNLKDKDNYRENFIIIIEETEDEKIVFSYEIIDCKFSDQLLTEIINKIGIEKNKATYLYSKTENEKIIGTLKQNSELDYSNIYQITYNLNSSKYVEVENKYNTISFNAFKSKENQNFEAYLMTTIYMGNDILNEFKEEIIGKLNEISGDIEINDDNSSSITLEGKDYYKVELTFNDKNGKKMYNLSTAYQIENDVFYVVSITSDKQLSNDVVKEFNNITYKK